MQTTLDQKPRLEATSSGLSRSTDPETYRMVLSPSIGSTTESGGFCRVRYSQGPSGGVDIQGVYVGGDEFVALEPASFGGGDALPHLSLTPSRQIHEVRRLSGLTWEEIAAIFGVSRRAIHPDQEKAWERDGGGTGIGGSPRNPRENLSRLES